MKTSDYLRLYAIVTGGLLAAVIGFNYVIDPYDVNGRFDIERVNSVKAAMTTHGRLAKAYAVRRLKPEAIALGSSRTEHALDMRHAGWNAGATPRYNLALGGASIYEIMRYFAHAQTMQPLKQVVIGIDFPMFEITTQKAPDFSESYFTPEDSLGGLEIGLQKLGILASLDTVELSAKTVIKSAFKGSLKFCIFEDDGTSAAACLENQIAPNGIRAAFIPREIEGLKEARTSPDHAFRFDNGSGESTFDHFRAILKIARQNGTDLRLFISPIHARLLDVIRVGGSWEKYEKWQKTLVAILEQDALENTGQPPFALWDFSGYNSITTEAVPALEDKDARMEWYWEGSHYKKELGKLVLDRIFDYKQGGRRTPADFGVAINASNIDDHLAAKRVAQRRYIESHPADIAELESHRSKLGLPLETPLNTVAGNP